MPTCVFVVMLPVPDFSCHVKRSSGSSNQTTLMEGAEAMTLLGRKKKLTSIILFLFLNMFHFQPQEISNQININNLPYGFVYKFRVSVYSESTFQWSKFSNDSNYIDMRMGRTT